MNYGENIVHAVETFGNSGGHNLEIYRGATEWRFAPGAITGWHRHEYDYVIAPVTGTATAFEIEPGKSYLRAAGIKHDVINASDTEQSFVEIEFKSKAG